MNYLLAFAIYALSIIFWGKIDSLLKLEYSNISKNKHYIHRALVILFGVTQNGLFNSDLSKTESIIYFIITLLAVMAFDVIIGFKTTKQPLKEILHLSGLFFVGDLIYMIASQ